VKVHRPTGMRAADGSVISIPLTVYSSVRRLDRLADFFLLLVSLFLVLWSKNRADWKHKADLMLFTNRLSTMVPLLLEPLVSPSRSSLTLALPTSGFVY
jgi:hypothetical protein